MFTEESSCDEHANVESEALDKTCNDDDSRSDKDGRLASKVVGTVGRQNQTLKALASVHPLSLEFHLLTTEPTGLIAFIIP